MTSQLLSSNNKERLKNSYKACCCNCMECFLATDVYKWEGTTALCPLCDRATVIGDENYGLPDFPTLQKWKLSREEI